MTQLPIDIAALLPSNAPTHGMAVPATGAAPVDLLQQSARFADALRLMLGENGQPVSPTPTSALLAMLPNGIIPTDDAVSWFTEDNVETDDKPSVGVLADDLAQEDTDDLSQFHFLTAVNAKSTDAPILTIGFNDDLEAEAIPESIRPAATDFAKGQNQSVPKVVAATAKAITIPDQTAESNAKLPPSVPSTIETATPSIAPATADAQDIAPSETQLTSDAANREPVAPRVTVTGPSSQSEEALAQPRVSASDMAGGQTSIAAQSEAESFLRTVSRIGRDVALKVEITPGQTIKPVVEAGNQPTPEIGASRPETTDAERVAALEIRGNAAAGAKTLEAVELVGHRAKHGPGSSQQRPSVVPVPESGVLPASKLEVKAPQQPVPATQPADTQTVIANESAKIIPLGSIPVETIDSKAGKTRTPVQRTEELGSTPSLDKKLVSKTDLPENGRTTATITKPVAAQPSTQDATHQHSRVLAGETQATSPDAAKASARTTEDSQAPVSRPSATSVKADPAQTQSAHTASLVNHGQATERAERVDSPPPARFQVEIPKPLRVPGQIRVYLDPPELGQVRVDLSSSREGIVGSLRVQSEQVRSIVEREIGQLQKTLQDAGVRVERLEVVKTSPGDSRNSLHANLNNHQSWSQNPAPQNAFGGTARGHAGAHNQNARQNQPEQSEMLVSHAAYPTMHVGNVNLVA